MSLTRLLSIFLLVCLGIQVRATGISIDHRYGSDPSPILRHAIEDCKALLELAFMEPVQENQADAFVHLQLPVLRPEARQAPSTFAEGRDYPYYHYPQHHFRWISRPLSNRIFLQLDAPTAEGVAAGLYALLQEQLGFSFVHPRQTVIPCHETWPLPSQMVFEGRPRFDKKGFHLHTQHPLELTQPLHDPDFRQGEEMVREYIDWLARNGQNYFEFCLLETVDLAAWVPYARRWVAYAHERGVLCSVDLSLHMVQQNAFKLVRFPPTSFRSFEKQIDRRLEALLSVGFDFVNMEFSVAEFVGGMENMRHRLREHVVQRIAEHPGVKLLGRQHVVKAEDEIGGSGKKQLAAVDPGQGILVHTVMCYALTDSTAPVYELDNFQHQLDLLRLENQRRETWFYPESAYWITFDNSIPLLHLPYLSARFRDLRTAESMGVPGHITFSSGWEWGYWLVDWSIARWSWAYGAGGQNLKQDPLSCARDILGDGVATEQLGVLMEMQEDFLLRQNYLAYLCPPSFADELPPAINRQFQPRPDPLPQEMAAQPSPEAAQQVDKVALQLGQFAYKSGKPLRKMRKNPPSGGLQEILHQELCRAIEVGIAYTYHQSHCWAAFREMVLDKASESSHLDIAAQLREDALHLVREMEAGYRYPMELIGLPLESHTAYDFGYLYPAHQLHLWERRERQIEERTFDDPFFMNIWDPWKIAGLRD